VRRCFLLERGVMMRLVAISHYYYILMSKKIEGKLFVAEGFGFSSEGERLKEPS
jgi:hypothetical protein